MGAHSKASNFPLPTDFFWQAAIQDGPMCDIVLLERDRLLCLLLGEILQQAGFDVTVARNPSHLLRVVHEAPPRVLVTSLGPQATPEGLLLARAARSIEPRLWVIYSTGREDISDHHLRRCEYCILKPYDPNALVKLVGEMLDGSQQGNRALPLNCNRV